MYMPKGKHKQTEDKTMWDEGTLLVKGTNVKYWVKHYDEPSEEYGIDGGRISKMELRVDGKTTLNYDRGWDIEPEDEASQLAYAALMKQYN
jgi:hypothetical protein